MLALKAGQNTGGSRFDIAVQTVLRHEGGLVDHKADPGGITNFGISLRFLKGLGLALGDIDGDGDIDADDIRKLTPERAAAIYRREFWDRNGYERITDLGVATKLLDLSVNMGAVQAHKIAQRAARAVGRPLADDGKLGPLSFAAINATDPASYLAAIRATAAGFYRELVARDARREVFLAGWLNRAYS